VGGQAPPETKWGACGPPGSATYGRSPPFVLLVVIAAHWHSSS